MLHDLSGYLVPKFQTSSQQVVLLSEVPLDYLFSNEKPSDEVYTSDEHRSLMDDLKITKDSVSSLSAVLLKFFSHSIRFLG